MKTKMESLRSEKRTLEEQLKEVLQQMRDIQSDCSHDFKVVSESVGNQKHSYKKCVRCGLEM